MVTDLLITYLCNCSCTYCYAEGKRNLGSMNPDVLDQSIDWIMKNTPETANICLIGGEPTVEPLLIERAINRALFWKETAHKKVHFTMTTNGILINEEMARKFQDWELTYMISIDGLGDRHDSYRLTNDGTSGFMNITSKLDMLMKYQKNISARVTIMPSNLQSLEEDLNYLATLGFSTLVVAPVTSINNNWTKQNIELFSLAISNFSKTRTWKNGKQTPKVMPFDKPVQKQLGWGCGAARNHFAIDILGDLYPCNHFVFNDSNPKLKLGDVYNGIDTNGHITKFQKSLTFNRTKCEKCSIKEKCIGGCPSANYRETGDINCSSDNECNLSFLITDTLNKISNK